MPAGYGWSFPARDEVRIGVGSFDPRFHVKEPTVRLAEDLDSRRGPLPGQLDPAQAAPGDRATAIFFVGDSAGHCLPLTAEGIRTAFYFGIACGRELRAVVEGRATPRGGAAPLRRVLGRARVEVRVDAAHPAGWSRGCRRGCSRWRCARMERKSFVDWSFGHYLRIAPPSFGRAVGRPRTRATLVAASANDQVGPGEQQGDAGDPARR